MTARKLVYKSDIPKLERAIELVQAGWCQGEYHRVTNKGDSYCLAGALEIATGGSGSTMDRLRNILATDPLIGGTWKLAQFNDDPTRKKYEVIRVMRRALVKARELAGVEA